MESSRASLRTTRRRQLPDLRAWLEASHPWPVAVVVALTLLIGIASAEQISPLRVFLLALAILGNQLAIGWANDYLDRDSDRLAGRRKPLVEGRIHPRALAAGAVLALLISLACGFLLGPIPLALLLVCTVAGHAYNLVFKDSRLSWLPYLVAFSTLPFFAWSALDAFRSDLLWLLPVALPLALVAHLANALPDIESDIAAGRGGAASAIGRRRALGLIGAGLVVAPLIPLASMPMLSWDRSQLAAVLAGYALLSLVIAASYARGRDRDAFRLVGLGCLVLVGGSLWAL